MSRNGSGTYTLPAGNPVVTGTTIASTWANNTLSDIASALTDSVAADGQTAMTGNLNLNSNKIVNVADPTLAQDAATKNYSDTTYLAKASNLSDVANATTARTNISAAKSGANSDITSLTGLTTPLSQAQGGTGTTTGYYGFKNRIINGAMVIDQRGGTVTGNDSAYSLDRWKASCVPDGKFTMQQSSTAPTGFINSMLVTSTSAYSVASSDFIGIRQDIEGLNCTDLAWGTAQAKTITLSFQVYSSLTGNFGGSLFNNAGNRSYPFSYTISSANTWTTVSVTIAGDTSGTWLTTNGRGICVFFSLGSGSSNSGTANAWAGSFLAQPTGSTSVVGTNGATFYITGVQLEVGSTATSFDYRPYGTELSLAQRYYFRVGAPNTGYHGFGAGTAQNSTTVVTYVKLPVTMRSVPTGSYGGTINLLSSALTSPSSLGITASSGTYVDALRVDFVTAGQTAAGGICAYTNNTASDFIQFSAEL